MNWKVYILVIIFISSLVLVSHGYSLCDSDVFTCANARSVSQSNICSPSAVYKYTASGTPGQTCRVSWTLTKHNAPGLTADYSGLATSCSGSTTDMNNVPAGITVYYQVNGTSSSGTYDISASATCSGGAPACTDSDGDGYGVGDRTSCTHPELDCDDTDRDINPGESEDCATAEDDDCDGSVNEGCSAPATCGNNVKEGSEVCDGTDLAGQTCITKGFTGGTLSCNAGCTAFVTLACTSTSGVCTTGAKQYCGTDIGECKRGLQTCTSGAWGACVGEVKPVAEVCDDNKDNDCDGSIDEACTCKSGETKACGTDAGECKVGTQTCTNNKWGDCIGQVEAETEICYDSKDNDCDGKTDKADADCYGQQNNDKPGDSEPIDIDGPSETTIVKWRSNPWVIGAAVGAIALAAGLGIAYYFKRK